MIQRLQSVFLLLAAVMMALLFAKPLSFLAIDQVTQGMQGMLSDGTFEIKDHTVLTVMDGINILLIIVALFLYKNRVLQIKLGWVTVALIIITCIVSGVLFWQAYQALASEAQVTFGLGYAMPLLAIIFLILAIRYIGKDEKLVRSADRLR